MRHSYIPFIIIAGIALLSSCARVSEIEQPTEAQKGTYTYTISASSQDTKTSYDAEGHFSWTAGDAISVLFHNGETNKFFTLTTSNSGALASFTGEIEKGYEIGASDGDEFDKKIWALFPASDNHSYTEGSNPTFYIQPEVDFTTHESANIPMCDVVASEGVELYFKNIACTYKFIVENIKDGVNKVQFSVTNASGKNDLSGSSAVTLDGSKYFLNYGWTGAGLTYTGNVTSNTAVFYVSCRYWGEFKPTVTVTNFVTGRTIKTFTATNTITPKKMDEVQPITLDVSEENGGDYYVAAVTIDDSIADWADVHHTITPASNSDKIAEWKYTKDSKNLYILYKVPTSIMNDGKYFYLGVDVDNNAETGADPNAGSLGAGMEYYRSFRPWRYSGGVLNRVGVTPADSKSYSYNSGSKTWEEVSSAIIVGGLTVDSYNYIEVLIPLSEIGSPSGQIRITHTFDTYNIGSALIMPEATTITAEDQTVDAGETVSIGAITNSTASLSYSSDDTGVATVDANGVITGVAAGTATITVSAAAVAGEYSSASKDITVTVTTPFVPAITIDGDLSDWNGITAFTGGEKMDRIREWRFKSDEKFVYIYLKFRRNRANSSRTLYIGFDTDNDSSTGSKPEGMTIGMEAYATLKPFTNDGDETTPEPVNGYDETSVIQGTTSTTNGKVYVWAYDEGDELQPLSDNNSLVYAELSIPRDKLGLPSAGNAITVQCCYQYGWFTTAESVTLE